mgnify:FL=1
MFVLVLVFACVCNIFSSLSAGRKSSWRRCGACLPLMESSGRAPSTQTTASSRTILCTARTWMCSMDGTTRRSYRTGGWMTGGWVFCQSPIILIGIQILSHHTILYHITPHHISPHHMYCIALTMTNRISSVYGPHRSFMSKNITIYHHIKAHGKRYKVDFEHEARLSPLTIQGRQQVAAWMQKHQSPAREQLAFFNDTKKDPTAEDVKLQYFSTGNIVEKYHEILCSKRRNVTFCPYDSPLNVRKTKTPRVPDQLSSGAERVE